MIRNPTRFVRLVVLLCSICVPFLVLTQTVAAASIPVYVSPTGLDTNSGTSATTALHTIVHALTLAGPGTTIQLAAGQYFEDLVTQRSGTADAPITITGPANAILKGAGGGHVFDIHHSYLTLDGFTIDGHNGSAYRDKLVYVQGITPGHGVTGLQIRNMTIGNAGGECVRLRYFAQQNEISHTHIGPCGRDDFPGGVWAGGKKNGEGIYVGTAPEQRADGKNPDSQPDLSTNNWIHHNTFNTQGNECVDIKEAATDNIVEYNDCTGESDPESGGFDARGSGNTFRYNSTTGNSGAGLRLGGDTATDGTQTNVYYNTITNNKNGGIKFQTTPQGTICGNTTSGNTGGDAVGSFGSAFTPTAACPASVPRPVGGVGVSGGGSSTTTPTPAEGSPITPAGATPTTGTPQPTAIPSPHSGGVFVVDGDDTSAIEAERASSMSGTFQRVTDSTASGGAYESTTGTGMASNPDSSLVFNLTLTNGGTFYVWLLGKGQGSGADSFWLHSDAGPHIQANVDSSTWSWHRANATLSIADGSHQLTVTNHEDGAGIDALLLTKDEDYRASDGDITHVSPTGSSAPATPETGATPTPRPGATATPRPDATTTPEPDATMPPTSGGGETVQVASGAALTAALEGAHAGTTIVIASGTYNTGSGFSITDKAGTANQPIVIRAAQRDGAVITGGSYLAVTRSSYVVIDGFRFTNTANSAVKLDSSNHVEVTHSQFALTEDGSSLKWVVITGANSNHNTIDTNDFGPKKDPGTFVDIAGSDTQSSQYDRIANNTFHDIGPRVTNGKEAVYLGLSTLSLSDGFTTLEGNRFENCDGDPEIVTVKTGHNTIRYNTFVRSAGVLSLRHGNGSNAYGNFFFGEGKAGTGGIRVYGDDHSIYNNYFSGLTGSGYDAALAITNGDANDAAPGKDLSKHYTPRRISVFNNTFVDDQTTIEIGYTGNNYTFPPRDLTFTNNLLVGDSGKLINELTVPQGTVVWNNNIAYPTGSAQLGIAVSADAMRVVNPALQTSQDGLQRLTSTSPAVHAGADIRVVRDAASGTLVPLSEDMDGQARSGGIDIGADQYVDGPVVRGPKP